MRNPVAFQRQELFPTYPWLWDLDNNCTHKFFPWHGSWQLATIPR
jgi:hypothetical protein